MEITTLPLDIILSITQLIDPLDIIHLGEVDQTCSLLHEICNERIVWTSAVRRMRRHNAVFPVFTTSNSCSLSSLRSEAIAPGRFVSLLKAASGYTASSERNRFVTPNVRDEVFQTIRLVPGGHLLVTASDIALRIWDLDSHEPRLIHTWNLNVTDILAITRTRDEDLRIAVATIVDIRLQLRIFDFNYATCSSKMYALPLEGWGVHLHFPVYTLSLDYFSFIIGSIFHTWNFTVDQYATWSIPEDDYERMDSETTQMIIFMSKTKLYGWQPKVHGSARGDTVGLPELIPEFIFDLPPVTYGLDTIRCSLATWYGSSDYSLIFDIATKHLSDRSYTFTSYDIHPPDTHGNPGYVKHLSTEQLPRSPTPNFRMQLYVYRSSQDRLFKMWYNEFERPPTRFTVAFRDNPRTPTDRFEEDPCVEVDLQLPEKLGINDDNNETTMIDANLDPASGRLCYLTANGAVGVLDYLPYFTL